MIAPVLCHVTYLMRDDDLAGAPEREHTAYIPLKDEQVCSSQPHFVLEARRSAERLTITIRPSKPLTVTSCRVLLSGDFNRYEKVLFNGYQSWTDTREVGLDAAMRGLTFMPKGVVDHFVLDGSGDYRFKPYANKPGVLHGWSYCYFIGDQGVWLAAGLRETAGFTLMEWNSDEGLNIRPEAPGRELAADEAVTLLDLALIEVGADADGDGGKPDAGDAATCDGGDVTGAEAGASATPEAFAQESATAATRPTGDQLVAAAFDAWFDLLRDAHPDLAFPRRREILTGYTSWYRHYEDIDEQKIEADLEAAARAFYLLDTAEFRRVFQIDDGYAPVGDWTSIREEKFPRGMRYLSDAIRAHGFTPGLWMAPFVCEKDSQTFKEHRDWLLHDRSGKPVRAGGHWSGSYALDILHPDVRAHVTRCLRTAVEEWGYDLLKLDFLYAACMVPHGGLNRGELMADGMRLIREAVGPDTIIDGCGVPLASAFGLVDFCRVGCDVGLDWDGLLPMRLTERERVSTRNSLFDTVYRAPLDGRAWGNDPDVLLLRHDVKYTDEQRRMLTYADACYASMLLTSDDFDTWSQDDRDAFQEALDLMRAHHRLG